MVTFLLSSRAAKPLYNELFQKYHRHLHVDIEQEGALFLISVNPKEDTDVCDDKINEVEDYAIAFTDNLNL